MCKESTNNQLPLAGYRRCEGIQVFLGGRIICTLGMNTRILIKQRDGFDRKETGVSLQLGVRFEIGRLALCFPPFSVLNLCHHRNPCFSVLHQWILLLSVFNQRQRQGGHSPTAGPTFDAMPGPRTVLFCIFWVPTIITTLVFASFSFFFQMDLDQLFGFAAYDPFPCSRSYSNSSSTSSSNVSKLASRLNTDSNSNLASAFCLYPVTGRYSLVRAHLGLEGRPIAPIRTRPHRKERITALNIITFSFFSLIAPEGDQKPLSFPNSPSIQIPNSIPAGWKRSLDFVLDESQSSSPSVGSTNSINTGDPSRLWQGESTILKLTADSSWDYSLNKQQVLDSFSSAAHRDEEAAALVTLARMKKQAKTRERERQRERQQERELQREGLRKKKERRKERALLS